MATINFGEVVRGDTWDGGEIRFMSVDESTNEENPIDLTGATIRCHLYLGSNPSPVVKFSTGGGGIGITAPTEGVCNFLPISRVELPVGELMGDLEITDNENKRLTYVQVLWTILPDFTK